MRRELIAKVLLMVVLFYTGLHLHEQQSAVLEGLRPGRDTYDWAGRAYATTTIIVAFLSGVLGFKLLHKHKIGGGLLLALSIAAILYASMILLTPQNETMQEMLSILRFYVVFGLWIEGYLFFKQPRPIRKNA